VSAPNSQPFFGVKVSKPGVPVQQATDKQLVTKDTFTTKTWYDNSNPRIVEGLLPDGTYGLWVSKPGFDVTNPNSPANNTLLFNSGQASFGIVQNGTLTLPTLSGNSSSTNLVDLGPFTKPYLVQAYIQSTIGTSPLPYFTANSSVAGLDGVGISYQVTFLAAEVNAFIQSFYSTNIPIGNYALIFNQSTNSNPVTSTTPVSWYVLQTTT
jgi:hypothetical protein